MRYLFRPIAIALIAVSLPATIAFAEPAPAGDKPAAEKHGPSADTLARIEDGRIAFAKAALKLTPEQEKLWAPVEEKIRANFAERQKEREEWKAKHADKKAQDRDGKKEKLALPESIEKRSERMTKMAEWLTKSAVKTKELAEVLKPLYASFSDEQKAVASRALDPFLDKGHGQRGSRWAMHRGFGAGHGPHDGKPDRAPDAE